MAGGHHHAGVGAEIAHREREHRGWKQPGEQDHAQPRASENLGRVDREHARVLAAVIAKNNGCHRLCVDRPRGVECLWRAARGRDRTGPQERGETCRGLRHEHAVHAVAARTDLAAQAGGAEREATIEAVGEVFDA